MSLAVAARLVAARRFAPLLAAQTLGAFNDNLFRYGLVTLAAFQGLTVFGLDRTLMVPIAATAFTLPIFLFSALAGQIADRFDRARVMRRAKLAEIALMALAAVGFVMEDARLLLLALFLMGAQSAVFGPARNAALPTLLGERELVTGNALVSGFLNVAILAGAGVGTILIVRTVEIGPVALPGALAVSAILIACAVLGWLVMGLNAPAPAGDPGLRIRWNIAAETVRVLGFALKAPEVLRPLLGVAWFWMLAAAILTLMPLFAAETLGADETTVLLFQVVFTVGSASGALVCGLLTRGRDALVFTIAGAIGLTVFPIDLALQTWDREPAGLVDAMTFAGDPANRRVILDLGLAAFSAGLFVVPLQAMAQRRARPEIRGRILAAGAILNSLAASLGQFVLFGIGLLALPIPAAFGFVAAGSGAAALFALSRLRGRARRAP